MIAEIVQEARHYQGLTMRQVAEKTSVSLGALGKIEKGGNTTIATLIDIAQAMGCTLEIKLIPSGSSEAISALIPHNKASP